MSPSRIAGPIWLIAVVAGFAIAVAVHLVVGSVLGTPQGRRLDPNSWWLQTGALGLALAITWRGFNQKRSALVVPGVLLAALTVIWIAQTG
jgi:uncharacterized membrane protein